MLGFEISINNISEESSNIDKSLSASKKCVCYSVLLIKISDFFFSILKNDRGALGVVTSSTSILLSTGRFFHSPCLSLDTQYAVQPQKKVFPYNQRADSQNQLF